MEKEFIQALKKLGYKKYSSAIYRKDFKNDIKILVGVKDNSIWSFDIQANTKISSHKDIEKLHDLYDDAYKSVLSDIEELKKQKFTK